MEIAAMKWANMDTKNLLTTKTTPTQTMNYHIISAHFTAMTKPSEILFDRTPENWPEFEHRLLTETETQPSDGIRNSQTSKRWTEHQNRLTSLNYTLTSLKT
jgi:hypothetical protein